MAFFKDLGKGFADAFSSLPSIGADMLTGGGYSNAKSVEETNAASLEAAKLQMSFQERMSSTAYERAMADMRRSGLNPMLAFDSPASTPSGAMPSYTAPRKGDVGAGLINSAKQGLQMSKEIPKIESETEQNLANAKLKEKDAEVAAANVGKVTANAKESEANTRLSNQKLSQAKEETRAARARADVAEKEAPVRKRRAEIDEKMVLLDSFLERVERAGGAVGSALGAAGKSGYRRRYSEDDLLNAAKGKGVIVP